MRILLICVLFVFPVSASSIINEVRYSFPIIETVDEADFFINQLEKENSNTAKAYIATMYFMKSKYVKFPITKYKYFKKGKRGLDTLIKNNVTDIEMRYLRFILQHQMPKFLGYHQNKNKDFEVITKNIVASILPKDYKIKILNTMLLVTNITETKTNKINLLLKKL